MNNINNKKNKQVCTHGLLSQWLDTIIIHILKPNLTSPSNGTASSNLTNTCKLTERDSVEILLKFWPMDLKKNTNSTENTAKSTLNF